MKSRGHIIGSMAALAAMNSMDTQTNNLAPDERMVSPHKWYSDYPHSGPRQRARYARQAARGQIRNAVCAWWCYPAMGGD